MYFCRILEHGLRLARTSPWRTHRDPGSKPNAPPLKTGKSPLFSEGRERAAAGARVRFRRRGPSWACTPGFRRGRFWGRSSEARLLVEHHGNGDLEDGPNRVVSGVAALASGLVFNRLHEDHAVALPCG